MFANVAQKREKSMKGKVNVSKKTVIYLRTRGILDDKKRKKPKSKLNQREAREGESKG